MRLLPRALHEGDEVALLSPASWSEPDHVARTTSAVESWGLVPRVGAHAHDRVGYLAGTDEDRLADLNEAVRDPAVRAIICLGGGCGSMRLVQGLDVGALQADPKPLVGYSDITALHRVWHQHGVPSLHGAVAGRHQATVREVLMGETPAPVAADPSQFGAELTTCGSATGPLFGGNLEMLARSVGVLPFDLRGHLLLLEINRSAGLGHVDRALTQLILSRALDGVVGVVLGWLADFEDYTDRGWTVIDVLRDHLEALDVPVLAGLPFGHGPDPRVVPLGVRCTLDADAGTVAFSPALVRRHADREGFPASPLSE